MQTRVSHCFRPIPSAFRNDKVLSAAKCSFPKSSFESLPQIVRHVLLRVICCCGALLWYKRRHQTASQSVSYVLSGFHLFLDRLAAASNPSLPWSGLQTWLTKRDPRFSNMLGTGGSHVCYREAERVRAHNTEYSSAVYKLYPQIGCYRIEAVIHSASQN